MAQKFKTDVERWRAHLAAERDAMALYRALAETDKDRARAEIWRALVAVEERHASRWIAKLRAAGETVSEEWRPGWRPRALGLVARVAGPRAVLPIVTALERGDAEMYVGDPDGHDLVREEEQLERVVAAMQKGTAAVSGGGVLPELAGVDRRSPGAAAPPGTSIVPGAAPSPGVPPAPDNHAGMPDDGGAADRAAESVAPPPSEPVGAAPHAAGAAHGPGRAAGQGGPSGEDIAKREQWHGSASGGSGTLRAAIFGVNDGLVSNTSLVMGVAGADVGNSYVLLAGIAGLLAGAFSMAAGEWISMQSQRELFERQIALERDELAENPEEERQELALIYQAKGVPRADAERLAASLMRDPDVALDTLAREELGLDPDELGSPWGAALSSFVAFSAGAVIPVVPYLLFSGVTAFVVAVVLAAAALFAVGAGVSLLTGRGLLFSGLRMMAIGALAAGVTYLVGMAIGVTVGG
jgi:vacuolar iron transporter family protein